MIDAEATIFNSIGAVSYFIWNIPESDLDQAHKVHTCFAAPAPRDIYNEFQERFGVKFIEGYGLTETGMATYHGPDQAGRPGLDGQGQPGLRGDDRGAGHRPARCRPTRPARSSWT